MSFIELSNVMFRGTLKAANGEARFKLAADAINAVDTVNIGNSQCTYDFQVRFLTPYMPSEVALATAYLNVPDDGAWVEVIAFGTTAGSVYVDGVLQPNRNRRNPSQRTLPFVSLYPMAKGPHTVVLRSNKAGPTGGYIMCRYIRKTGT